jgi:predicted nucleic acid-binding protein
VKRVVLDASGLMTFFEDRAGAQIVEELVERAIEGKVQLMMSAINWGEVYYSTWRMRGEAVAKAIVGRIAELPIEVVLPDLDATRLAAELKAQHKIPYADAFAATLAQSRKAALATSDADFASLKSTLDFVWIR